MNSAVYYKNYFILYQICGGGSSFPLGYLYFYRVIRGDR